MYLADNFVADINDFVQVIQIGYSLSPEIFNRLLDQF
jgi:hypothetical protein